MANGFSGTGCTFHFESADRATYTDYDRTIPIPIPLEMNPLSSQTLQVLSGYISTIDEDKCSSDLLRLIGTHLYEFLLPDSTDELHDLRNRFETLCTSGARFGVQLELDSAAWELAQLPWEFLYIPKSAIFLSASTKNELVLTRHVPNQRTLQGRHGEALNVLVAINNPESERATVDERSAFEKWVKDELKADKALQFRFVSNLDVDQLSTTIEEFKPDIFHFVGHGEHGALWLMQKKEEIDKLKTQRRAFRHQPSTRGS